MDSECQDWLFGDLFTKNGTTMEELLDYVHPILQEDSNEMNPNGTAVNLDDGGVSVAPPETDALLDNRPELCEGSYTTVRNEFVTENRLPLMISTQQASHAERDSSTRRRAPVAKRKRRETRNNVVSNGGTQVAKRILRWSDDEHARFLRGLLKYGKSHWKDIANKEVRTRTPIQVASHAQKHFSRQVQTNKMRLSINDFSVKLNPSKCVPDTPESSSAAVQRHSRHHANNIPDPRYGTVRVPPAVMQPSSVPVRHNFNTMQSPLSSLEQRHSGRSAYNLPDPRYGMVRVPPAVMEPSSIPVRHNFNTMQSPLSSLEQHHSVHPADNIPDPRYDTFRVPPMVMQSSSVPVQQNFDVIASRYIPAQRNPGNVPEGERRNFGGPIQPQHLEEQYYLRVAPQHLPANNFPGGGNFWPGMELAYYPVTTQMFPGQFDNLSPPPL